RHRRQLARRDRRSLEDARSVQAQRGQAEPAHARLPRLHGHGQEEPHRLLGGGQLDRRQDAHAGRRHPVAGGVTEGAAHLGGGALHGLGGAAEWAAQHTGGGKISSLFGGAANKLEAGGDAVDKAGDNAGASIKGGANNAAGSVQGAADGASAKIKEGVAKLGGIEAEFRGRQHTAKTMYQWMYAHGPLDELQDFLRPIPKVGPEAASKVHSMQQEMHRIINGILATAWNKVLDGGVNQLNKVIGTIREKTN